MGWRRVLSPISVLLLVAALGGCGVTSALGGTPYSQDGADALEAAGVSRLYLKNGSGEVRIEAWDEPRLQVTWTKRVRGGSLEEATRYLAGIRLTLEKAGDTARLVVQWPSGRQNLSGGVDMLVQVPAELAAQVHLGAGALSVRGLHGNLELESGAGSIAASVDQSPARVQVQSGAGRIDLSGFTGAITVESGAGAISVASPGAVASLQAHTGTGRVEFTGALAPDGLGNIGSGAGSIAVRLQGGAEVEASSDAGSVRVTGPRVLGTDQSPRRFIGRVGDGGGRLRLETAAGSIDLQS